MSTNFYWRAKLPTGKFLTRDDPTSHIGKRTSGGLRRKNGFIWAQDSGYVRDICMSNVSNPIIVDEYDKEYTGNEFIILIREYEHDYGSVGTTFC
jgi:hypothetical protein